MGNKKKPALPLLEEKAMYFGRHKSIRMRKKWYRKHYPALVSRARHETRVKRLAGLHIWFPPLDVARWVLVDTMRHKPIKFFGVYQFVGLPGEGKTLSMVAHMERFSRKIGRKNLYIATNFFYRGEDMQIVHWTDIIKAATHAKEHGLKCIVALDEIHILWDSGDWKSFPAEMLSLLSFDRKLQLQFLCSSQIYDRIPKKIRDIGNYTVICKNWWSLDRYFINYYFDKTDYEDKFAGKKKLCDAIVTYVASDDLYAKYDTLKQIEKMTQDAQTEKDLKEEAFRLLFEKGEEE